MPKAQNYNLKELYFKMMMTDCDIIVKKKGSMYKILNTTLRRGYEIKPSIFVWLLINSKFVMVNS